MNINLIMSSAEVDKGWSWFVCVGSVVAIFLENGTVKALGVLLPVLRQQFATKTWIIGLVISLVPGFGAVTCKCILPMTSQMHNITMGVECRPHFELLFHPRSCCTNLESVWTFNYSKRVR